MSLPIVKRRFVPAFIVLAASYGLSLGATPDPSGLYLATAYAQKGVTASGVTVHQHVVAADPDVLPLGSRIKIKHAGRYSGEYVVADTGEKIQGRHLDIYLPSARACKKFGTKTVKVRVIQLGDGTRAAVKEADHAVKQDVKQDVANKVVGNAATEADWTAKKTTTAATTTSTTSTSTSTTKTQTTSTTTQPDH